MHPTSSPPHSRPKISAASLRTRHAGTTATSAARFQEPNAQQRANAFGGTERRSSSEAQSQGPLDDNSHNDDSHQTPSADDGVDLSTLPPAIDAFELPQHVRHSSQDIKNLFSAAFGAVYKVEVVDAARGHARVQFYSPADANVCLGRIIQHEEMDDAEDEEGSTTANTRQGLRRRGFVFLGYYRILIDGRILSASSSHLSGAHRTSAATPATRGLAEGSSRRQKRERSPTSLEGRSTAQHQLRADDDDDDDDEGDDDDDDRSHTSSSSSGSGSDEEALPQEHTNATTTANEKTAGTGDVAQQHNCLVLLRIIELPVIAPAPSSSSSSSSAQHQPPATTLSGLLSPLVVYQMLRDVCLPLKIVLCKKQQSPYGGAGSRGPRAFETRNVLVQLDKHESVAAVVSAFNGTVVELMENSPASTSGAINGSGNISDTNATTNPNVASIRVGVGAAAGGSALPPPPLGQQQQKPVVAARFRVLACESRHDSGRPSDLNVPVNIAGCMSISKSTIMKMGGIFDRSWVMTPSTSASQTHAEEDTDDNDNADDTRRDSSVGKSTASSQPQQQQARLASSPRSSKMEDEVQLHHQNEQQLHHHSQQRSLPSHRPQQRLSTTHVQGVHGRHGDDDHRYTRNETTHRSGSTRHDDSDGEETEGDDTYDFDAAASARREFPTRGPPAHQQHRQQHNTDDHNGRNQPIVLRRTTPPRPHASAIVKDTTSSSSSHPNGYGRRDSHNGNNNGNDERPPHHHNLRQQEGQQLQQAVSLPFAPKAPHRGAFTSAPSRSTEERPQHAQHQYDHPQHQQPQQPSIAQFQHPPQMSIRVGGVPVAPSTQHQHPLPISPVTSAPAPLVRVGWPSAVNVGAPVASSSLRVTVGGGGAAAAPQQRRREGYDDEANVPVQQQQRLQRQQQRDRRREGEDVSSDEAPRTSRHERQLQQEHPFPRQRTEEGSLHNNNSYARQHNAHAADAAKVVPPQRRSSEWMRPDHTSSSSHAIVGRVEPRPSGNRSYRSNSEVSDRPHPDGRSSSHGDAADRRDASAYERRQETAGGKQPNHEEMPSSADRRPQQASPQQLRAPAQRLPPPPPPRDDWSGADSMQWEAVFSEEYRRTYFIGTNAATGQQLTSWDLPMGARLGH